MSHSTSYKPVMASSAVKPTTTSRPGLWTRITDRVPFLRRKRGIAIVVIGVLVIIGGGLSGLAALHNRSSGNGGSSSDGSGGGAGSDAIKSDAYFYGNSPAVYPSRKLTCSMFSLFGYPSTIS
jgi:hypothetical protein